MASCEKNISSSPASYVCQYLKTFCSLRFLRLLFFSLSTMSFLFVPLTTFEPWCSSAARPSFARIFPGIMFYNHLRFSPLIRRFVQWLPSLILFLSMKLLIFFCKPTTQRLGLTTKRLRSCWYFRKGGENITSEKSDS